MERLLRILMVDDDEEDYLLIRDMLGSVSGCRCQFEHAPDRETTLRRVEHDPPELILLDYRLGAENGLELLQELKAKGCRVPVILLTGCGDTTVDIQATAAGAADYLVKGKIDADGLERCIRHTLAREKAEAERMRLANHIRLLLESTEEGIYGIDADGRCSFINPAAARMLGYEAEELIGRKMHTMIHHHYPDGGEYPEKDCPIQRAHRVNIACHVGDEVFWRKNGSQLPVEYSACPIVDEGKVTGAVVTFSDITARKDAEEKLRRVMSNARCIVWDARVAEQGEGLDWDMHFHYDDFLQREFGIVPRENESHAQMWMRVLSAIPGQLDRMNAVSYAAIRRNDRGFQQDFQIIAQDGARRWLREDVSITPLARGHWHLVGVAVDGTELKRAEEARLQAERLAVIGSMSAKMAHEIRNPLGSVLLNLSLMQDEMQALNIRPEGEGEEVYRLMRSMDSQLQRVERIIQDYLRFAKMPKVRREPTQLNELLSRELGNMKATFEKHRVRVQMELDPTLPQINADEAQVWEAILNLTRNAMEVMPEGGSLRYRTARDRDFACLTIADSGPGMSEETRANLFKPFFTTKKGGTGLGLPLVLQILGEHGGRVECESAVGRGTTFHLFFPLPKP